jgi:hypothetical protein
MWRCPYVRTAPHLPFRPTRPRRAWVGPSSCGFDAVFATGVGALGAWPCAAQCAAAHSWTQRSVSSLRPKARPPVVPVCESVSVAVPGTPRAYGSRLPTEFTSFLYLRRDLGPCRGPVAKSSRPLGRRSGALAPKKAWLGRQPCRRRCSSQVYTKAQTIGSYPIRRGNQEPLRVHMSHLLRRDVCCARSPPAAGNPTTDPTWSPTSPVQRRPRPVRSRAPTTIQAHIPPDARQQPVPKHSDSP